MGTLCSKQNKIVNVTQKYQGEPDKRNDKLKKQIHEVHETVTELIKTVEVLYQDVDSDE